MRTDKIWDSTDVESFLHQATPEMALALRLALDTAQRQGDLIKLTGGQYKDGKITLRQNKTGKAITIPCTQQLITELDQTSKRATTILTGRRGRPWSTDGFRTEWYKISVAAGVQDRLTFHDLRGTAVTRLAEAGCTVPEIAAISGHSMAQVTSILESYLARTNALAHSAIAKLEDARNRNRQ